MLVFGTQIHIVTFIFIVLEFCMLIFQLARYFYRPQDKQLEWYLLLLVLMLFYNITGGLFPDPQINITISTQMMIAYGSGFLMASYFPFYFYKALEIKSLRWHALFGVPLFLILPYIVFFVIDYAIDGNLNWDIKFGMIIPFIYALVLLYAMFKAIRHKFKLEHNRTNYIEEIGMYFAITPWAALAFFGLVETSQLTEVLCTNTGIIAISILFVWNSIQRSRFEYHEYTNMLINGVRPELFMVNCLKYNLTNREIEIIQQLKVGMKPKQIGDKLFIAERTVTTHLQNAMNKTHTKSRLELIRKLENGIFEL